jgi:exopolysaccharide biosynthesis polyprenyl glycosylphosphotransferase
MAASSRSAIAARATSKGTVVAESLDGTKRRTVRAPWPEGLEETERLSWPYADRRMGSMRDRLLDLESLQAALGNYSVDDVAAARPTPSWLRKYFAALASFDAVAALVAVLGMLTPFLSAVPAPLWALVAFPFAWGTVLYAIRAYDRRIVGAGTDEYKRVVRAGVVSLAVIATSAYIVHLQSAERLVLVGVPVATAVTLAGRYGLRRVLHAMRRRGRALQRVVAVGHEAPLVHLVEQFRRERWGGLEIVAACVPEGGVHGLLAEIGVPVLGNLSETASVVRQLQADAVAVTSCPETHGGALRQLAWQLEGTNVELFVAPGLMEVAGPRLHIRPVAGLSLLHVEEPRLSGIGRLVKGALDRVFAGLALLVFLPFGLVIAAAVRLSSQGPALFRQIRVGVGGKEFTLFKFRSMYVDAEARLEAIRALNVNDDGLLFKIPDDPRVTTVGRILRRLSIDELPQLLNVMRGEMSLVGPRPPLPSEVEKYGHDVMRRLLVKPGLTGLWQVSGRSDLTWEESVRLDLRYVENWSLTLDLTIIWKTMFAVVRGSGAY